MRRDDAKFTVLLFILLLLVLTVWLASCADPQRWRGGRDWCAEVDRLDKCA